VSSSTGAGLTAVVLIDAVVCGCCMTTVAPTESMKAWLFRVLLTANMPAATPAGQLARVSVRSVPGAPRAFAVFTVTALVPKATGKTTSKMACPPPDTCGSKKTGSCPAGCEVSCVICTDCP